MAKLNWRIVDRYFAGEATAAERELVEQWLTNSPAFRMLVSEIYRTGLDESAMRQAKGAIRERLDQDMALADHRRFPAIVRAIKSRSAGVLKAAAVIAVLIGGILVVRQAADIQVAKGGDGFGGYASASFRTIQAPAGRRESATLPDGSHVILSPGSTLRYATALGTLRRREVQLQGKAYFNVAHDREQPFVVRAGNLVAEDLGTQFVARAYPEDRSGRVVVREGLVGVAGTVVSPGEIVSLSPAGNPVVERADTASWFAWTEGRLVFDGTPLRDALPKLSHWYDLDFQLSDPALGNVKLVAALPEGQADALEVIALALRLRVTRDGRQVTLERL